MKRISDYKVGWAGKELRTMKRYALTGIEFSITLVSKDGREVQVVFHQDGRTIVRGDDSCKLEHN